MSSLPPGAQFPSPPFVGGPQAPPGQAPFVSMPQAPTSQMPYGQRQQVPAAFQPQQIQPPPFNMTAPAPQAAYVPGPAQMPHAPMPQPGAMPAGGGFTVPRAAPGGMPAGLQGGFQGGFVQTNPVVSVQRPAPAQTTGAQLPLRGVLPTNLTPSAPKPRRQEAPSQGAGWVPMLIAVTAAAAGIGGYFVLKGKMETLERAIAEVRTSALAVQSLPNAQAAPGDKLLELSEQAVALQAMVEQLKKESTMERDELRGVVAQLNETIRKVEQASALGAEAGLDADGRLRKGLAEVQAQHLLVAEKADRLEKLAGEWQRTLDKQAADILKLRQDTALLKNAAAAQPPRKR